MSRGGRAQVIRPTRAEACAQVVAEVARELAPACRQAVDFFFQGVGDFIATPVPEATRDYEAALQREGAQRLATAIPELARKHEELRYAIARMGSQLQIGVPDALTQPADIVTAVDIRLQEEALAELHRAADAGDVEKLDLDRIDQQLQTARTSLAQVMESARLIAARHLAPEQPLFETVDQLLRAQTPEARRALDGQIASWADGATAAIRQEVRMAWSSVVLAAAQLSAGEAGLIAGAPDVASGRIVAHDADDPTRQIEVKVKPDVNELSWELSGYEGGTCKPVEEAFLQALGGYLGVEFTERNVVSYDTEPTTAGGTARRFTAPTAANTGGPQTYDNDKRERH